VTEVLPYVLPVAYTIFVWWFSTGVILWLNRRARHTYPWSMAAATVVLAVAIVGLVTGSEDASLADAYHAFTAGVVIWGWHEMTFLMGFITGPRKAAQSPDARGWRRFVEACAVIAYHELAIAVTAVVMVVLTWDAPNPIGTWTFLGLWGLRLSAKLNLFFGVPNFTDEFLPTRLGYLRSYFPRRTMNLLFPVSVTGGTVAVVLMLGSAWGAGVSGFAVAGLTCLATLVALAVLEHWFLVLPLRDAALWQWAFDSKGEMLGATPQERTGNVSVSPTVRGAAPAAGAP
jgi:putative photosynthetic complex assembly protein 2